MIEKIKDFVTELLFFILWMIGVGVILVITGLLYVIDYTNWRNHEDKNDRRTRKKV
tara:strand:+ start:1147 stop:1314 length:168 start_codon:yes stop_codon:yes gene_type:complete